MKKSEIEEAIKKGKNNISELARYFNLTPATIRYYINKYGLRNEIKKKRGGNEIIAFTATWMDLERTMLSEVRQ